MKNRFRGLSESRKLEMLQMSVEEIYNAVYWEGFEAGFDTGAYNERTGACEDKPFGGNNVPFHPVKPKTPNQRRAELIQRAREFAEEQKDNTRNDYMLRSKNGRQFLCVAKFVHNSSKRTTTCILIGISTGYTRKKVTVRCHPNEVFNESIGEVISLCKALEIEIPQDFMDAVQPDEFANGQVILYHDKSHNLQGEQRVIEKTQEDRIDFTNGWHYKFEGESNVLPKILDDTNAEYEVS